TPSRPPARTTTTAPSTSPRCREPSPLARRPHPVQYPTPSNKDAGRTCRGLFRRAKPQLRRRFPTGGALVAAESPHCDHRGATVVWSNREEGVTGSQIPATAGGSATASMRMGLAGWLEGNGRIEQASPRDRGPRGGRRVRNTRGSGALEASGGGSVLQLVASRRMVHHSLGLRPHA